MFADDVGGGHFFVFPVFFLDDLLEFGLVPVLHGVVGVSGISHVHVERSLLGLAFYR